MRTSAKLAAFAAGSLLAFSAAFGLGRVVGPVGDDEPARPAHETTTTSTSTSATDGSHAGHVDGEATP